MVLVPSWEKFMVVVKYDFLLYNLQTLFSQQPTFGLSVFDDLRPHPTALYAFAPVVLVAVLDEFVYDTLYV